MTPPPSTVATADEAHALVVNPGGLGFMEGPQAVFAHSGADLLGPMGAADSVYGGLRLVGRLTLAAGADWIRPPMKLWDIPTVDARGAAPSPLLGASALRLNVGAAFRFADELSVGFAYRHTLGTSRATYNLGTLDAGVSVRPLRYLIFGAALEQGSSPFVGNDRILRSVRFGAAVRPYFERVTFSWEARLDEKLRVDTHALARVEVVPGVSLFLDAFHLDLLQGAGQSGWKLYKDQRLFAGRDVLDQLRFVSGRSLESVGVGVGFQVDTEHVGAGLLGAWMPGAGFLRPYGGVPDPRTGGFGTLGGGSAYVRLSAERYPSLLKLGSRAIMVDVEGDLGPQEPDNPLEGLVDQLLSADGPPETLALLDQAARDRRVRVVALRIRNVKAGWGRIVELRERVEALRKAGKRVVAYMEAGGDEEYHIASAADRIYLSPAGQLSLDGFAVVMQFVGATLDRVGVHVQAIAAGKYKSAPEQLTRTGPSPENQEVQRAILDGLYDVHTRVIARNRSLTVDKVKEILDRGILSPAEAAEEHLVDGVIYEDELEDVAGKQLGMGSLEFHKGYGRGELRQWKWAAAPAIAVVPLKGDIKQGRSGNGPGIPIIGGGGAGSDDLMEALEAAGEDDDIKAVVLRVDSPGGDSMASDLIWNAVAKLRKKKPVIASFGDLAASGGYYAACGTDLIVAEPTTLTGSIGVFALSFEAQDLLDRVGVTSWEETRGKLAGGGFHRPLSDDEKATIERYVGLTYKQFLERVHAGRRMPVERVHELAQGRVWTGAQAKEVGLVDELGGLVDAIELAKSRVGLGGDDTVEVRIVTGKEDTVSRWGKAISVSMDLFTGERARREQIREAVALLLHDPDAVDRLMLARKSRSLALMPYTVTVR
ncbi:MAG: signal peptide peptidase SppA [Deltaproteobacteria bacterium]|nr:signal peptide peptidase SppA [Deltaproteobacteria bacterium]